MTDYIDTNNLTWFAIGLRCAREGGVAYAYAHSQMEPDAAYVHWLQYERAEKWIDSFNAAQQGAIRDAFLKAWNAWITRKAILLSLPPANSNEVVEREAK